MQSRQPRLGDIVDDYCPRERRLTNHAVVAMVGSDIKQTRCTTCDAEHEYKHAKVPSVRKKKESAPALFKQVLASAQPEAARAAAAAEEAGDVPEESAAPAPIETPTVVVEEPAAPRPAQAAAAAPEENAQPPVQQDQDGNGADDDQPAGNGDDEGPVHRRLIRAQLPRPEGGTPTPRPLPQFTVRQPGKFGNANTRGGRPGGGGGGQAGRVRTQSSRGGGGGGFGRNPSRDGFSGRPSGSPHGPMQRTHHGHRPAGRPLRHGKKSK